MKNKKVKNKEILKNISIVIVILLFISVISAYFYFDHLKVKKNFAECVEICKPDEALEIFSKKGCFCKKVEKEETIHPKDTI